MRLVATPLAGGPVLGERGIRPQMQAPPKTPIRKALSSAWLLGRRAGRDAGWAGRPRSCPPQAGPARRAATGRSSDRLGQGPDRPVQALRARKKGGEDGREPPKGEETRKRR